MQDEQIEEELPTDFIIGSKIIKHTPSYDYKEKLDSIEESINKLISGVEDAPTKETIVNIQKKINEVDNSIQNIVPLSDEILHSIRKNVDRFSEKIEQLEMPVEIIRSSGSKFDKTIKSLADVGSLFEGCTEKVNDSASKMSYLSDGLQLNTQNIDDATIEVNKTEGKLKIIHDDIMVTKELIDKCIFSIGCSDESIQKSTKLIENAYFSINENGDAISNISHDIQSIPSNISTILSELKFNISFLESVREEVGSAVKNAQEKIVSVYKKSDETNMELRFLKDVIESDTSRLYESNVMLRDAIDNIENVPDDISRMMNAMQSILSLKDSMESSLREMSSVSSDMKKQIESSETMSRNLNFFVDAAQRNIMQIEQTRDLLESSVNSINTAVEGVCTKLNDSARLFDRKTDDTLNITANKLNELILLKEPIESSSETLAQISSSVKDQLNHFARIPEEASSMRSDVNSFLNSISAKAKKLDNAGAGINKSLAKLAKTSELLSVKNIEQKELISEIKKMNLHLKMLDDVDFVFSIMATRKKIKKIRALPTWAIERKGIISRTLDDIENEMLDILIATSLKRTKMNFQNLKKTTGANSLRLRNRLAFLMENNRIRKEKIGKYFVYALS